MIVPDMLRLNAAKYPNEVALVEINPERQEDRHITWREYDLIETTGDEPYRREITWSVFDERANRLANLLLSRGVHKGDKVAILLYNCIEWLPIYFGILKTGATAVPLNFRYSSDEIAYCMDKADVDVLLFGPEFIGRVEEIVPLVQSGRLLFYVGDDCPTWAESYRELEALCSSHDPQIPLYAEDDAAIYFSSGTTGFPKAILHNHESLTQAAEMEAVHHGTTHEDVFLCIPPLYHTGAKFHWMGSLTCGSKAVLLRGVSPEFIFDTVSREGCTIVWLLVPWVQDILAALERGDLRLQDYELDQWRLMHVGAQPVPKSLIQRWKEVFPHHDYDTNYGLSESTGPGCVHLGVENIDHVGAIGIPGYRWECKIIDDHGNEVGRGAVGELCVKGPGLMTQEGRDHHGRREPLPRADRGLHHGLLRGAGRCRDRPARRAPRRDRGGHHRAQAGRERHGGGHRAVLQQAAALQASAQDHLRRRSSQRHGKDREAAAARALRRRRSRWQGEQPVKVFHRRGTPFVQMGVPLL